MKSPAWKYFLRNKKDGLAKCKNCLCILKMGQSTSPLIKHLKSHNIDLKVPKYLDLLFKALKTVKPTSHTDLDWKISRDNYKILKTSYNPPKAVRE